MGDKRLIRKSGAGPGAGETEILRLLAGIKLLSVDVDGVLTDGGLYYADDGRIHRKYNVKDGVGIKRAMEAGIEVAIVSAGVSASVPDRARTLGIAHVFTGVDDKLAAVTGLCETLGIDLADAAHIGDDLNDVPLMEAVGCAIAVADAEPDAWEAAVIVTERDGGAGAVREICDLLIKARGQGGEADAGDENEDREA